MKISDIHCLWGNLYWLCRKFHSNATELPFYMMMFLQHIKSPLQSLSRLFWFFASFHGNKCYVKLSRSVNPWFLFLSSSSSQSKNSLNSKIPAQILNLCNSWINIEHWKLFAQRRFTVQIFSGWELSSTPAWFVRTNYYDFTFVFDCWIILRLEKLNFINIFYHGWKKPTKITRTRIALDIKRVIKEKMKSFIMLIFLSAKVNYGRHDNLRSN